METYTSSYNFAKDMKNDKREIFKIAYENKNDKDIILGLLDGIICRYDDILHGFIKQFNKYLSDEELQLSLEHTCLSNRPQHIKTIISFINNKKVINEAYEYVKNKNLIYSDYLESYIEKNKKENNINIKINNLSVNIFNLTLDDGVNNKKIITPTLILN